MFPSLIDILVVFSCILLYIRQETFPSNCKLVGFLTLLVASTVVSLNLKFRAVVR